MADTYTELFYHVVWATKNREPMITSAMEPHLWAYLRDRCRDMEIEAHALNGISDPMHLVCSIPPKLSVADVMEKLKGSSAHFINHLTGHNFILRWQRGYSVLSFAKRDLPRVVNYVLTQKEHPARGRLSEKMEMF